MAKPSLFEIEALSSVAAHRSFRQAADALGVSRSSLSHTITAMERHLGIRLLHRTTRSVAPTEAGDQFLAKVRPLLRQLAVALDEIADVRDRPAGTLRINVNEPAARLLLASVVPRFLELYPEMALDMVTEGRLVDIVAQGFDAGVRLAEAVPQDMIAIPFGGDARFVAIASPLYLTGRTPLVTPDDLQLHSCIRQRLPSGKLYRWEFEKHGHEIAIDVPGVLTLDNPGLMVEAALSGLGIGYVPERSIHAQLADGTLLRVLDDWCPRIPGLCLYYSGHRHVPAGLRAFIDLLKRSAL